MRRYWWLYIGTLNGYESDRLCYLANWSAVIR
jgi:hypothetical protein